MQSLAMMLTNLLPDILILAFTVFQISNFESSVPFLEATIDTKDMKCASFPNLPLSTLMVLMHVILTKADIDSTFNSCLIPYLFHIFCCICCSFLYICINILCNVIYIFLYFVLTKSI